MITDARSVVVFCIAMTKRDKFTYTRDERAALTSLKKRMREEPSGDFRIQKLIKETGMNRTKLHHGFYFFFGVHIHAYLTKQRLVHAKKLLTQTKLPLKAVSIQSGFEAKKYFFRFFKQRTSYTPTEYRKRYSR